LVADTDKEPELADNPTVDAKVVAAAPVATSSRTSGRTRNDDATDRIS